MNSPVLSPHHLAINPEAHAHHSTGLEASIEHKFAAAYKLLDSASLAINLDYPTIDSRVQHAAIVRDRGFTSVREAVVKDDPTLLEDATTFLYSSRIALRNVNHIPRMNFAERGNEAEKLREINSERAATSGMIGRLATAQMVLTGETIETEAYQEAHEFNLEGSNGYYRVNNAVNAARHERLSSKPKETIKWLGRAAFGLAWTVAKDRGNLKQAILTTGDRVLGLRSKKAAKASVLRRP